MMKDARSHQALVKDGKGLVPEFYCAFLAHLRAAQWHFLSDFLSSP